MPNPPNTPASYILELPGGPRPIEGAPTSVAAFVAAAASGPLNEPVRLGSFGEFEKAFGGLWANSTLGYAVRDFFVNGGTQAVAVRLASGGTSLAEADFIGAGKEAAQQGLYALEKSSGFNLLCLPPYADGRDIEPSLIAAAAQYCERKRAFFLVDPPAAWVDARSALTGMQRGVGTTSANAAVYFPRLLEPDPLRGNQVETFAPCGAVAGVIARNDMQRGVWKAPAGVGATLTGVTRLSVALTDGEASSLSQLGINCLRPMPAAGPVVWGARTLQGAQNSEWKYVNVRRFVLFVEESISRGIQWAVFEPNGPPLWAQISSSVEVFLRTLWRQGALQGTKPDEAYFVRCGAETTTQTDIENGVVNILVGLAALKPAEFVIIRISQMTAH